LADDLINSRRPVLRQLFDVSDGGARSVLAVEKVAKSATRQYGIVKAKRVAPGLHQVSAIVEKPAPSAAPSRLGVVGRYVLTPRIFAYLRKIGSGAGGEIQLTDGIAQLLKEEDVFAFEFSGVRYDCGSKLGYAIANLEYGRKHKEIGMEFSKYLKNKSNY